MKAIIFLGSMCALVAHTATALAAPSWCKGGDEKPSYDFTSLFTETDANRALDELVAASCYPESDVASMGKQITATRAAWSKRLGLTEADWSDVSEWSHLQRHLKGDPKIAVRDRQAAWSAYSPIDQYGALSTADIGSVDAAYLADAFGMKLTQLGRLGYVAQCLSAKDAPATWAMCAADVTALDHAKLAAEIRADTTHSAGDRMTARIVAYETIALRPKHLADTKALQAKDPAYAKMWTLADAARQEWSKADTQLIAIAEELDAARVTGSRKASAGCIAKTWDAWKTTVAAIPAKKLATIQGRPGDEFITQLVAMVVAEQNGYLAAFTLNACATLESKEDLLTRTIGYSTTRWPGFRGPRTAAHTAILTAGLQLDDRSATIEFPEVNRDWIKGDGGVSTSGLGAIESVKIDAAKDRATVTFAKQKVTQNRCTKGHYTNRINQIMPDGTFHYYYVCDTEITETIEVAPSPPLPVGTRYVSGIKPGMTVSVVDDIAVVAYPKGKTTPAIVTGVEVK